MDVQEKPVKFRSLHDIDEKTSTYRVKLAAFIVIALSGFTAYLLLKLDVFHVLGNYRPLLQRLAFGTGLVGVVLTVTRMVERSLTKNTKVVYTRYNLTKMLRLITWLFIIAIAISLLYKNWYSAVVSLGLISLILGFALQTPISSFIGWLYVLIRQPYHVGDRIQIDAFRGDVVEVNYMDTTLWEFSGDYLTNDLPSGRLIRFPNSLVLESAVVNYSWDKFPFIWNEIPFHVAYNSDLKFVEDTIRAIAEEELGEKTQQNIEKFKYLVSQTPVDELEIKEYPHISFRINANTWVEVLVTYLVEPKKAAATRSRLIKRLLSVLNEHPDRVQFPAANNR
jgi:small-conductance mechanosensitive channel